MIRIPHIVRIGESIDGRIARILAEKKSDLMLDNFGNWLAALIRPVPGAATTKTVSLKDTSNAARTLYVYSSTAPFSNVLGGTRIGVGSSSTPAARTDYNLGAILGSLANTTDGVWTSSTGQITFSGSVYLVSGGTVRETGFLSRWADGAPTYYDFMLFHDIVSDVVISAGKYAFVQYTIQL